MALPSKGYQLGCASIGNELWNSEIFPFYQGAGSLRNYGIIRGFNPPYKMTDFNEINGNQNNVDINPSEYIWDGDELNVSKTIDISSNCAWYAADLSNDHFIVTSISSGLNISSAIAGGNGTITIQRNNIPGDFDYNMRVGFYRSGINYYTTYEVRSLLSVSSLKIKLDPDPTYTSSVTSRFRTSGALCTEDVIDVSANYSWIATINESWIHLDVTTGSAGVTTTTITVDATTGERSGTVSFKIYGTTKATLYIDQTLTCV